MSDTNDIRDFVLGILPNSVKEAITNAACPPNNNTCPTNNTKEIDPTSNENVDVGLPPPHHPTQCSTYHYYFLCHPTSRSDNQPDTFSAPRHYLPLAHHQPTKAYH